MSNLPFMPTRRSFTLGASSLGLAALLGHRAHAGVGGKGDAQDDKKANKRRGISVGYAAITWGDRSVRTAIAEIAAAGYSGIQLRGGSTKAKTPTTAATLSLMDEFKEPAALKAELDKHRLTFACVSGGGLTLDPTKQSSEMEKFVALARFARDAGALSIQATSPKREKPPETAQLKAFGQMLNEVGKQTAGFGMPLVFHNHMNQIGEKPEEVAIILEATDPAAVKLLLDTGHWAAAGGDPIAAVKSYARRLEVLHIKDVRDKEEGAPGPDGKPGKKYEFVELGQGKVNFKGVFKALKVAGFSGWAVVELDAVPAGREAKDAAVANREFLQKKVGLKV
jgi:inosose dehydratase